MIAVPTCCKTVGLAGSCDGVSGLAAAAAAALPAASCTVSNDKMVCKKTPLISLSFKDYVRKNTTLNHIAYFTMVRQ